MKKAVAAVLLLLSLAANAATKRYDADIIGPMNVDSLAGAYKQILDAPGPDVSLRIFSPGWSAIATMLFIDLVRDRVAEKHLHITCVGTGIVASAAAILFESPACGTRVLEPQAALMFHEAYLKGGGPLTQDMKEFLRTLNYSIAALIAPKMGISPDVYLAWITDGVERWVTSAQALAQHMVDRVEPWEKTHEVESPPPL